MFKLMIEKKVTRYTLIIIDQNKKVYTSIHNIPKSKNIDIMKKLLGFDGIATIPYTFDMSNYCYTNIIRIRNTTIVDNVFFVPLILMIAQHGSKIVVHDIADTIIKQRLIHPMIKQKAATSFGLEHILTLNKMPKMLKPYILFTNNVTTIRSTRNKTITEQIQDIKYDIILCNRNKILDNMIKFNNKFSIKIDNLDFNKTDKDVITKSSAKALLNIATQLLRAKTVLYKSRKCINERSDYKLIFFGHLLPFLGINNIKKIIQQLEIAASRIIDALSIDLNSFMQNYNPYLKELKQVINEDYFIKRAETYKFNNADEVTEIIINNLQS